MDSAGRVVLPKALRERFNLVGGSRLELVAVGDRMELTPIADSPEPEISEANGLLVIPATGKPIDVVDALNADREERDSGHR